MVQVKLCKVMKKAALFLCAMLIGTAAVSQAQQLRDKRVHSRGMLHETIYNTGEIGRAWYYRNHDETSNPLMEWPGNSATVIDGVRYPGQHNIIGGGVHIAMNYAGQNPFGYPAANPFDLKARVFSFCGSSGQHIPLTVAGIYCFPMELERSENFPVLESGDLNPDYDPDEAEEIIYTKFATNSGITVERTSRAWSYPDYDDMIIYEYTFENTGDLNGDGVSDTTATLYEVLLGVSYGMGTSMMGYQRWYGTWEYDFMYKSDARGYWDRHRWLNYVMNVGNGPRSDLRTDQDPRLKQRGAGKPDPVHFYDFAETGRAGGGLMSPQAAGYQVLYYDVNNLADSTETFAMNPQFLDSARTVIDPRGFIKQPFINKVFSGNSRESKMEQHIVTFKRYSQVYTEWREKTYPPSLIGATEEPYSDEWVGRGEFNFRQSWKSVGHYLSFGPYTLEPGEKVHLAVAEVVGYGATEDPDDVDEGGGLGEAIDEQMRWHYPPRWNDAVAMLNAEGEVAEILTDNYLEEFGYPDYVNSDVKTVKDVADKAWFAYSGRSNDAIPYWPEENGPRGTYQVPMPPPAPAIALRSNGQAHTEIEWGPQVEQFEHPRLTGPVDRYRVSKSPHPIGPWTTITEVQPGSSDDVNAEGNYMAVDTETKVGESQYYAVTSVDAQGNESGKTNLRQHETQLGAVTHEPGDELSAIHVVPNPFYVESNFSGGGSGNSQSTPSDQIGFYGLPQQATIRIYSYAGQLVETIEHDADEYSTAYYQVSRNHQEIASGVYFYVVETPDGAAFRGKFVIIK